MDGVSPGPGSKADLALYDALETRFLSRAGAALRTSGVEALLFKGAAVARTTYPASWQRARADADLLIPPADWDRADKVLTEVVGGRLQDVIDPRVMGQWQYRDAETGLLLDVHCRLFEPAPFASLVTFDELAEHSLLVPGLEPARGPGRVHALWIALLHPVAHHGGAIDAVWEHDVALLAAVMTADDWPDFVALAKRTETCAICRAGLRRAAPDSAPAVVIAELDVRGERSARLMRARADSALGRHLAFLIALPSWRARAREARARLMPPSDYMLACYGPGTRARLPWLYVRRIVEGLAGPWRARSKSARARFEPPA
jgi:Uncharacterised nucleotidyltransferase